MIELTVSGHSSSSVFPVYMLFDRCSLLVYCTLHEPYDTNPIKGHQSYPFPAFSFQ